MTLEIITADSLLPLRHGFFTRKGGASSGVFNGLNCGAGSSDQADVVALNRRRVATAMGVAPGNLVTLYQVHSATAITITAPPQEYPTADAIVTATPGIAIAVLTADCQPVLFADTTANVIGAAHAGWRGARDGILEATIEQMERLGARRDRITSVIGPCISQLAYEVGPGFHESFGRDAAPFFAPGKDAHQQFDLPGYSIERLRAAGVKHVECTRHCTYSDPDKFYSYRRSVHAGEADYGRLISAIRL